ncbi:myosin-7-like [Pecten maximus]|uniref:myosin-7-like n=1 Tax=Pecten maximus TaxID=6579 RepID=UPI00145901CD|nr:myosin-7-like [Pecten maximus]
MQEKIKHMQDKIDEIRAQKEELETVLKKRTQEGSKLRAENTRLVDKIVVIETQLDAQNKAFVQLKEMHSRTTAPENETEVKMSAIIEKLQCDLGTKDEELQAEREKANIDIQVLSEAKNELEEKYANNVKEIANATEVINVLQKQVKTAETRVKESETSLAELKMEPSETSLAELKMERQKLQETMEKQLQTVQEKANADIQVLSEDKILLEKKNAIHVKEIANLTEEIDILQKQLKKSETQVEKSETSLAELKMERQTIEESMEKQMAMLQDDNARHTKEIFSFTEENNRLRESQTSMECQIQTLNKELTGVSQTKNEMEMALETLEKEKEETEDVLNTQLRKLRDENSSYVHDISKATEEIHTLRQTISTSERQIETLTEKITSMSQTINELEAKSRAQEMKTREMQDALNKQLKHLQEENCNYRKENADSAEEIERLKRALTRESQSRNELEKTVRTLEGEKLEITDRLTKQVNHLQELTDNVTSGAAVLGQDNNKLKDDLSTHEQKLNSARKEIEKIREQNLKMEKEISRQVTEIDRFTKEVNKLKTNSTNSERLISKLEKDVAFLTDSKSQLESLVHELQIEKQEIRKELTNHREHSPDVKEDILSIISGFHCDIDRLKLDLHTKTEELESALNELREIKSRKKTVVMGLRTEKSGMGKTMVDMVSKELTKRLQTILERENIIVTVQLCQTPAEVPNGPLVVLCLNMSRVGTNILDALAGIKANHDVLVLVLHNAVKENLSLLTPTSLRVTGNELRQLGGIVDMAFNSDSGVYDCDLNTRSVENIATTLRKYSR